MHFEKRSPLLVQLGLREDVLPAVKNYLDLLWAKNEELNLISRKMTYEELIDNHVVDCLLPLKMFPTNVKNVADFGSGGGLPGVIYAIQFPKMRFRLYEKSNLKREFLESCKKIAPNLEIHGEIPPNLDVIEIVTARAFKPVDVILDISRDYYKKGGKYFLLKGRREKINEEVILARKKFKNLEPKIEVLTSPLLEVERHLVLI